MIFPLPLAMLPAAIPGGILLAGLIAWSLRQALRPDAAPSPRWKWWLVAALTLLAFRWPVLGTPHQLNPDESQLIAGAITLQHDPVFWRSVDGSTAGPLDFYPLLPAAWVEGPASYAIARLIGLAATLGALFFLGETVAIAAGTALARIALLPVIAFLALTSHPDFVHCSTEVMPVLLYSAAGYFALAGSSGRTPFRPWLVGGLLGCMPWAKLQALPMAATLWMVIAGHEVLARRSRALVPLFAGALLPTLACFAMVAFTGQTEHLIVPYLTRTFLYVVDPPEGRLLLQWRNAQTDGYLACWIAGLAVFAAGTSWRLRVVRGRQLHLVLLAVFLVAVGVWSVIAPSRPSTHHLLLLVPALVWMGGIVLAVADSSAAPSASAPGKTRLLVAGLFLACGVLPLVVWRWRAGDMFAAYTQQELRPARRQLTELIRRFSTRDEPLAVWGWRSSLYVEAGRRQATRQAHSEAQIYPSPLQGYFLRRYIEDFQAANPPVFADAVGPGNFVFEDRTRAHECFPQLRDWVQAHYTLVADLDGTRLYVRDDRLAGEHALPVPPGP